MNILQFGIASIVDSNTGHGFSHVGGRIDYGKAENDARSIRSRTVTSLVQQAAEKITTVIRTLRQQREHKRRVQQLSRLNDHLLDDIGLSRGDIIAAQLGQIDLEQLVAARRESQQSISLQLSKVQTRSHNALTETAANEALYARANCA